MNYGLAPAFIQKRISLTRLGSAANLPTSKNRVLSPQGNRWLINVSPDYSKNGLWNTTLYIGNTASDVGLLQVMFIDHGNTFSANWINDKLLFIQVWWGRIASSDLILDATKGTFLYDEFANYGELMEPCR